MKEGLHFNQIVRILDLIPASVWNAKIEAYAGRLADVLEQEGYADDAGLIRNHIKSRNGERIAMAVQDDSINTVQRYVLMTDSDGLTHEFNATSLEDALKLSREYTKPGGIFASRTWKCTTKDREFLFEYNKETKQWVRKN